MRTQLTPAVEQHCRKRNQVVYLASVSISSSAVPSTCSSSLPSARRYLLFTSTIRSVIRFPTSFGCYKQIRFVARFVVAAAAEVTEAEMLLRCRLPSDVGCAPLQSHISLYVGDEYMQQK